MSTKFDIGKIVIAVAAVIVMTVAGLILMNEGD